MLKQKSFFIKTIKTMLIIAAGVSSLWFGSFVVKRISAGNKIDNIALALKSPYFTQSQTIEAHQNSTQKSTQKSTNNKISPSKTTGKTTGKTTEKTTVNIKEKEKEKEKENYEIVLTSGEIEELIVKALKGKYPIENIKVSCSEGGGMDIFFDTAGIIPGFEYIAGQRISIYGTLEEGQGDSRLYYSINSMQVGSFKIPQIFISDAEDYLNQALVSEIVKREEYFIETADVRNDSVSFIIRRK